MRLFDGRPRLAAILVAGLLGMGLVSAPVRSPGALAAFTACGSDPVVSLSNGTLIDLSAQIRDSISDVRQVAYVIHAPRGTRMIARVNKDGIMGLKETFQFYADRTQKIYDTLTTVYTIRRRVAIKATTSLVSPLHVTVSSRSATGMSWQNLAVEIVPLH